MILGVPYIVPVYFIYGLAFFSMGLLVAVEGQRASDVRLRRALPPLAGFGIVHAAHEWMEMYVLMGHPASSLEVMIMWGIQVATLAFSFVGSFVLLKVTDALVGLRVTPEEEATGLDLTQHAEAGYAFSEGVGGMAGAGHAPSSGATVPAPAGVHLAQGDSA